MIIIFEKWGFFFSVQKKEGTTWGHVKLIFDEHAAALVFVRKQMGKMRKTELVAHTF